MHRTNRSSVNRSTLSVAGLIALMAGHFSFTSTTFANEGDINVVRSVIAERITADNVNELQRRGPDAIGGIGDWFISNGIVCAVISDTDHESEFSTRGGSLVDLGFCDRDDDHFAFTHDLINGSRRRPLNAESVNIETFNDSLSIVVRSAGDGARLTTRYHFSPEAETYLSISKRYAKAEGETVNFISPFNFNYHSLEPFIFNSQNPRLSNGFNNEDFSERGISAIDRSARAADTIIAISPRSATVPIAYGWHLKSAKRMEDEKASEIPSFVMADKAGFGMLLISDTFYLGGEEKIGWPQLPQVPLLTLDEDVYLDTEERVYIGQRGDVASITDQLIDESVTVSGSVNESNTAVHIQYKNGAPFTHIRPQQDGSFRFKAPAAEYQIIVQADANRKISERVVVEESVIQLPTLELPKPATLTLPKDEAMRLVFVGINGTTNPDFSSELTGASVAYDDYVDTTAPNSAIFLAGVESDLKQVNIAPGEYRVYATKGPEFSLEKTLININQGERIDLNISAPKRVIDTPNHIASDLHVHSGWSFDTTFAETERVRTFVAEHGEVMVASEHDRPTDYAPYIEQMGVKGKIVSIPAAEVTSTLPTDRLPYTSGHTNFFPLSVKPELYRNGLVNHENKRQRDILHAVKQHNPDAVAQLNHPRFDLRLSGEELPDDWEEIIENGQFFDHMGVASHPYNPHQHLHSHPNKVLIEAHPETGVRDIDFDLIEVVNGAGHNHHDRRAAARLDWLSLLKQGERIVGTANSDSHTALEQVAVPRTMVAVKNDTIASFEQAEFVANLKAGNAYGTTGPMLEVSLLKAQMGDTFSGSRGTLTVKVSRAPWVNVDRLEVQINGETVDTHRLTNDDEQVVKQPLEFNQDSFVTVEVSGPANEDYTAIYPDISPYAFSNPIYVDADQDGQWKAPGLSID